jgi:hypothetical protein
MFFAEEIMFFAASVIHRATTIPPDEMSARRSYLMRSHRKWLSYEIVRSTTQR